MDNYLNKILKDKLPLIKFDLFDKIEYLNHGFTTRLGGVSKGDCSTMNLSFTRGDDENDVLENYRILSKEIGYDVERFVASHQTHTTNILRVTKDDCGKGIVKERDYTDIDGLITDEPGVVLFTYYADCVPLFFADKTKKIVAVSHSGWKGTVNRMGKVTVDRMCNEFGSKKEDIICAIGPSICKDCYEVSKDLYDEFTMKFDKAVVDTFFYDKGNDKYLLDLWKVNEYILLEAGILKENIENRRICTCCNKEVLFSHRGLNGKRGNLAGFIVINE